MGEGKVAVVIPYYHTKLNEIENISFRQCLKVLYGYPIILVTPDTMKKTDYPKGYDFDIIKVPSKWMQSVETYNQMMLNIDFYRMFLKYEYILIYQLDAFVFSDRLTEFCDMCYDYIGAPWPLGMECVKDGKKYKGYVGNGGFSLRNVMAAMHILKRYHDAVDFHEDMYWSSCDSKEFRVAPKEVALKFSIEMEPEKMFNLNQQQLPFGCHAWNRWGPCFWKPFIENEKYMLPKGIIADNSFFSDKEDDIWMMPSEHIRKCMKKLASEGKKIYIWGAGTIGERWIISFRCAGLSFRCVDSSKKRWGEHLWDVLIESPVVIEESTEDILLIIAVKKYENEIKEHLSQIDVVGRLNIYSYKKVQEMIGGYQNDRDIAFACL